MNGNERETEPDITKPLYHFRPRFNWMNDPNGTVKIGDEYHVFYQYDPHGSEWGSMHWGHATTKDLLSWKVHPDMLRPEEEKGENHCFSGCIAVNDDGVSVLTYTSVKSLDEPFLQKSLMLDEGMHDLSGERHIILSPDMPEIPAIRTDWRDPYIFRVKGKAYMLLAAALYPDETPSVLLFSNPDGTLTEWKYEKVFMRFEKGFELMECPNFFRVEDDRWVFMGSPYGPVRYMTGSLDDEDMEFRIESEGTVDRSDRYYATNTIIDDERTITLAFIRGWNGSVRNWNNVLSMPRRVTVEDGVLIQEPVEEMKTLRREVLFEADHTDEIVIIEDGSVSQMEISFIMELNEKEPAEFSLYDTNGKKLFHIGFTEGHIDFDSIDIPLGEEKRIMDARIFVDHTVVEAFFSGGRYTATRVIDSALIPARAELRGFSSAKDITAWKMDALSIDTLE